MSAPTDPTSWGSAGAEDDSAADYAYLIRRGWEMELLISGFLTFALLQVPGLVDEFTAKVFIEGYTLLTQNNDLLVLVVVKSLCLLLAFHFLFHIIVRTIWIGHIGLELSFEGGMRLDQLRLLPRYRQLLDGMSPRVQVIRRLDKVASAVYGFSVLVVCCLISTLMYFLYVELLIYVLDQFGAGLSTRERVGDGFIVLMAVLGLDFFSGGALRRALPSEPPRLFRLGGAVGRGVWRGFSVVWGWLQWAFYPIHVVAGYLSIAKLYRPLYYTFMTRLNRRWFGPLLFSYLLVSVMVAEASTDISLGNLPKITLSSSYTYLPSGSITSQARQEGLITSGAFYEDRRIVRRLAAYKMPFIASDVLPREQHTLRLTIPYWQQRFEAGMERNCPTVRPFAITWWSDANADSAGLAHADSIADMRALCRCLSERYVRVAIDDSLLPPQPYLFSSYSYELAEQPVLVAYLPTDHLAVGRHRLQVRYERQIGPVDSAKAWVLTIPFYKE